MEKGKPNHISISDEIEVPTIAADTATILESEDRIAIPINFEIVEQRRQRNLPQSVLPVQRFCFGYWTCCFFYFLVSIFVVLTLSSLVALLTQSEFLKCDGFLLKNPTIWRKRRDEIDVRRYPCRGSLLQVSMEILNFLKKYRFTPVSSKKWTWLRIFLFSYRLGLINLFDY